MNCVVLFVTIFVTLASAYQEEECTKLANPVWTHCCKVQVNYVQTNNLDLKECFAMRKDPPTCDAEICKAKKRGYAGEKNGTFDKKLVIENIRTEMHAFPEVAELIIKDCINGDLTPYGPQDACQLDMASLCIHAHAQMLCVEWNTYGDCPNIQELTEACAKFWKEA